MGLRNNVDRLRNDATKCRLSLYKAAIRGVILTLKHGTIKGEMSS